MKLYFGDRTTTVTTIMIIALVDFIGYSVWNRDTISFWGRRNLFLLIYGLVICCFAAARDGLDKTIQAAIDGSCTPGMVLCDVQWSNAESCSYGDRKNDTVHLRILISIYIFDESAKR